MHRHTGFAVAAVLLAVTAGCGLLGGSQDPGPSGGPLEKSRIKVSIMPTTDLAPFHLALKNGYFEQEGLAVETVTAPNGPASVTKMLNGEVGIAYGSYPPFLVAKGKGVADVRIVADSSSAGPASTVLVAMPDSPVKGVTDLAGKRVAVTGINTIGDLLLKAVMKANGVDHRAVRWREFPFPDIAAALRRGDVDAGFLTEPFITQAARTVGAVPVVDLASGPTSDFPTAGYCALAEFTSQNPRTVAAFQRVMKKATAEAADRAKIEPLLVEFAKIDAATAASTRLLTFRSEPDAAHLQRGADLMTEFGVIPDRVDVSAMIVKAPAG